MSMCATSPAGEREKQTDLFASADGWRIVVLKRHVVHDGLVLDKVTSCNCFGSH
jgi:hypothetical protein